MGTDPTIKLRRESIARLRFCYLSVLPSTFAVACAFVTFPRIGRNRFALLYSNCQSYKGEDCELEAGVDNLFDEGGSGKQAEQGVGIQLVSEGEEIVAEDAAPLRLIHQKKRKTVAVDAEHEGEGRTDSVIRPRAISAPPSTLVIIATTTITPTAGPATVVKEKIVKPSFFSTDSTSSGTNLATGGFVDLSGSNFLIGGIRTVISPDTDLQKVYVPQWRVTNGSLLDDGHVCCEMVDEFTPLKFFASILGMNHNQLFTEFNVGAARRKGEFDVKATNLAASVKVKEQEVADLDAMVTSVKLQNDNITDQVHKLETSSTRLQKTIGKVVKKGMQDGLSAEITHGAEGRVLNDVGAYNPSAEANYLSSLQRLQSVNFSLILELKSNKDASIDTIMNLLHLEDSLANKLDVSSSRARRIKENTANHRSALHNVVVPLFEPLSIMDLTCTKGASNVIPTTIDTTTALSVTFSSASLIPLIFTDDYEIMHAESEESVGADADSFPNVDDVELNTS
nr:hypothetical protein [Tanacetum cinerariifolium]